MVKRKKKSNHKLSGDRESSLRQEIIEFLEKQTGRAYSIKQLGKSKYLNFFENNRVMDALNQVEVSANDVFFIPAGRIHSIGKGILLAEIQQTSDVTYRIYDFDRQDSQGNARELHTNMALDAIDFNLYPEYKTTYKKEINRIENLATTPYFTTNRIYSSKSVRRDYHAHDSFVIYTMIEGSLDLEFGEEKLPLRKGDVALLPAEFKKVQLDGHSPYIVLETYIDQFIE